MEDHDHPFFITRYMVKKYQGLLENQYECNYIYIYVAKCCAAHVKILIS
jgi:hypothetical protein